MEIDPDLLLTQAGRDALTAEAVRANRAGFQGNLFTVTRAYRGDAIKPVTHIFAIGAPQTFLHLAVGDPKMIGHRSTNLESVPVSEIASSDPKLLIERIAAGYLKNLIESREVMTLRERAAAIDLTQLRALSDVDLERAATRQDDQQLLEALRSPGARAAISAQLHREADVAASDVAATNNVHQRLVQAHVEWKPGQVFRLTESRGATVTSRPPENMVTVEDLLTSRGRSAIRGGMSLWAAEGIAIDYIQRLAKRTGELSLREKAALVEMTAEGLVDTRLLHQVARSGSADDRLKRALEQPMMLRQIAAEFHAEADKEQEIRLRVAMDTQRAERQAWFNRTGGTLEGEARARVAELDWRTPGPLSPVEQRQKAERWEAAEKALAAVAKTDPLAAAIIFSEARHAAAKEPGAWTYAPYGVDSIRPTDAQWRQYSLAVTNLFRRGMPTDPRLTMAALKEMGRTANHNAFDALAWYAYRDVNVNKTDRGGAAEFIATCDTAKRLLGHNPQCEDVEENAAFTIVQTHDALRKNWETAKAPERADIERKSMAAVAALGGRDLTRTPVKTAAIDYLKGKDVTLGELFHKTHAHAVSASAFPRTQFVVRGQDLGR